MALVVEGSEVRREDPSRPPPYRADIDGLRALAIGLVVVYHVWFGRVSGGVDVFLMISAYFMTASFARRLAARDAEPLFRYWSRRFARLLPAAVVTMIGILVAVAIAYPSSSWQEVWRQTWASLFYFQNWELAASSIDYYDRDTLSPLQHFWSLSIQGQVFIVWPVIMVATALLARRFTANLERSLVIVFGAIFLASLAYSVIYTAIEQQAAYFSTFARLWEFALGSLLALAISRVRLPRVLAAVIGWVGIVGIVLCGAVLDVQSGFPGFLALWPILSAAAVILAGSANPPAGPTRLLASPVLGKLSGISYALYLVHWPVLVTWLVVNERTTVSFAEGAAIIGLSLILAIAVTYLIERPVARLTARGIRRAHVTVVISVLTVALPLAAWQTAEGVRADLYTGNHPGARVLMPGGDQLPVSADTLVPLGSALDEEWVDLGSDCTAEFASREPALAGSCRELRPEWRSSATVFVVGDSHAQQWMGALLPIAEERNWTVVALLKGGCAFAPDEPLGADGCEEWREAAFDYVMAHTPDMLYSMGTKTVAERPTERALRGIEQYTEPIAAAGTNVVLVRDNPRFTFDAFQCVEENGPDAAACIFDADEVLARQNPAERLDAERVTVVDLSGYLCPNDVCSPTIGGVVIYLDRNHLTWTYAETLSLALEEQIADAISRTGRL